jgi:hypothetical protein
MVEELLHSDSKKEKKIGIMTTLSRILEHKRETKAK